MPDSTGTNRPAQQHPLNQRAEKGERRVCTLDCGDKTSTGGRGKTAQQEEGGRVLKEEVRKLRWDNETTRE